jgi:protein ImuB
VLAERAVALAADLGLRCRAAVADGRAPARALARHGVARAPAAPGAAAAALAPLPLAALELAPPLASRLAALGLREVGDLARLPGDTLAHRFGAPGLAAWRLAHGDDPSPLVPYVPARLPEERLDLEAPVESAEPLLFALKRLCDRVAARLAGRGLGATRLSVALALDPRGEERLEIALALPSSAASRWLLVLRERIGTLRLPAPVVAAVLAVAEAAPAPVEQLAIGDRPEQLAALEVVLTRLAARLGDGAVFAAQPVDRHRPEAAYQAGAFGGTGRRGGKGAARAHRNGKPVNASASPPAAGEDEASPPPSALVRPTRLLARPQPLVALGEGGRLTALRVGGRTLRVLALSPAERLAGEWWGDPFDRDYHRARIEGLGDCWIFRDAGDGRLWLHGFFD